ncbi:hypothetical protein B5X24_HaOG203421 [Helicoverpa armigera]|uniref:Uncharacterized protein n=1 Tax=Helicoverpa armigera TaxID=29058 RepID=A0A2W1BT01_HELAM|nr:hypothetical protein B5X24_HaOG203421 [Helicoverpa armigera]
MSSVKKPVGEIHLCRSARLPSRMPEPEHHINSILIGVRLDVARQRRGAAHHGFHLHGRHWNKVNCLLNRHGLFVKLLESLQSLQVWY